MINAVSREIPDALFQQLDRQPFAGTFTQRGKQRRMAVPYKTVYPGESKLLASLDEAIERTGLQDGMTISFHHHLRNGDLIVRQVMEAVDRAGITGLTLAVSALFDCHHFLENYIRRGVVRHIEANYIAGSLARSISKGLMDGPVIMRTHGGRDRALEAGDLIVDIAFIAAPSADPYGNLNATHGPSAFGSFGYAAMDARYAKCSVAITDNLVPFPLQRVSIDQTLVDYVVQVNQIGDPSMIVSGTTQITRDPIQRDIALLAARAVQKSGYFQPGFSLQTGAGGISLAVASALGEHMKEAGIKGSFGLGGITGAMVDMLQAGLFNVLLDAQCFDLRAVESLRNDSRHREISCATYSNPHTKGAVVNMLDVVILGATEIDLDFNVNVTTSSDGVIMGGSGGHADAAAGSKLCVIVANLNRCRIPVVVDRVETVNTPGETVDMLVTDRGIAVNPLREDVADNLRRAGLPVFDIHDLKSMADRLCGVPAPLVHGDRIIAAIEYRDGTLIDVVREVI
jgi:citrate lyase subunit alpha/citrate CoA-transferase